MPLVPMTPAETSAMIEDVRSHGFDPAKVVCCVPSAGLAGSVKGVMGCNVADRCEHHLTKNGGFRNQTWRPRNMAVLIKPEEGRPNTNQVLMSCCDYVRLLQNRAEDGALDRKRHGAGEIIRIVAHEGEQYTQIVLEKVNPANPNTIFHEVVKTDAVPEFKHPSQLAGTSAQRAMLEGLAELEDEEPTGPPQKHAEVEEWDEDSAIELGGKKEQ